MGCPSCDEEDQHLPLTAICQQLDDCLGFLFATLWTPESSPIACASAVLEAFIGLEFQEATTVRCVRLFQNVPRDVFEREQRRSWTAGFALQRWTGGVGGWGVG